MLVLKSRGGGGAVEIDVPAVEMRVNNMDLKIPYKLVSFLCCSFTKLFNQIMIIFGFN